MLESDRLSLIRSRSKESVEKIAPRDQSKAFVQDTEVLSNEETALVQISKLLGRGGFGSVHEGTFRGRKVALKKMKTNSKHPRALLQSFQAETSIASFCHSPHCTNSSRFQSRPFSFRKDHRNGVCGHNNTAEYSGQRERTY